MDLLRLPRLRNLYHSENELTNLEDDLKVGHFGIRYRPVEWIFEVFQ